MNQMPALVAALSSLFGPQFPVVIDLTLPATDECGVLTQYEVGEAIKDGAVTAVIIPSTLNSCYFFDASGRLTGTVLVQDEYSTYFPGMTGA